ncbi:MAG: ATP-binding protein, partial [Acidobacteriota bacterium]|nr:ATP-binding protein [Acidobacteriota bacterium]
MLRTTTLSPNDAALMVMREEDHFFDCKALSASGKTIQKIAVALANSDGGEFAVGIADHDDEPDPGKRWNCGAKVEDFNAHLQAMSEIKPPWPLSIRFSMLRTGLDSCFWLGLKRARKC